MKKILLITILSFSISATAFEGKEQDSNKVKAEISSENADSVQDNKDKKSQAKEKTKAKKKRSKRRCKGTTGSRLNRC